MHPSRNHLADLLRTRFLARTDAVAVAQQGLYPKPATPLTALDELLLTHLHGTNAPPVRVGYSSRKAQGVWSGHFRVGSYTPNADGLTPWLCIDFDGKGSSTGGGQAGRNHSAPLADPKATALRTYHALHAFGLTPYIECSASTQGWHVWVFFEPLVPALKVRLVAYGATPDDAMLASGSVANPRSAEGIEIFPKQNAIKDGGYGNLVWLPWWSEAAAKGGNQFHRLLPGSTTETEPYLPEDFATHTEADIDAIITSHRLADRFLTPHPIGAAPRPASAPIAHQPRVSSTNLDEQASWREWRSLALARLDLREVYGSLLTGHTQAPGWLECRDPASPTGDRNPSAGVADSSASEARGTFKSFRDGRVLTVFDFLVNHGPCGTFQEALRWVAERTATPLPDRSLPDLPDLPPGFFEGVTADLFPVTASALTTTATAADTAPAAATTSTPGGLGALSPSNTPAPSTGANDDPLAEFGIGSPPTPPPGPPPATAPGSGRPSPEEEPDADTVADWFLTDFYRIPARDGSGTKLLTLRYWNESFWVWEEDEATGGHRYRVLKDDDLKAQLRLYLRTHFAKLTPSKRNNVLDAVQADTNVKATVRQPSWLTKKPSRGRGPWFAFANGVADLALATTAAHPLDDEACADDDTPQRLSVVPHSPEWFSPVVLPYAYDPDAACPTWLRFLGRVMENDAQRIAILQEYAGYCFLPDMRFHKFIILHGEGNNGKGVFLQTLERLVGLENRSTVPLEKFEDKFALFSTLGKLVNIAGEIGELDKVSEGFLKMFSAGDTMSFEQKFKDVVSCPPTAKLVFACNTLPRFSDRTNGIWRRLIAMPFNVVIPPSEVDRRLADKLVAELPGIFNWALAGLRRLLAHDAFTESEACRDALEQYQADCNPTRQFLMDEVLLDGSGSVASQEIYRHYSFWMAAKGNRPLNEVHFAREFKRVFPEAVRRQVRRNGGRLWVYEGISLANPSADGGSGESRVVNLFTPYKDDDDDLKFP